MLLTSCLRSGPALPLCAA